MSAAYYGALTPDIRRYRCLRCEERADCALVSKKVGGDYRRASRYQECRICRRCVDELLASVQPGQMTMERWSVVRLRMVSQGWPDSK